MSDRLKPCPFCGDPDPEIASGDMVICSNAECGVSNYFSLWNCRVPGLATAKLIMCIHAKLEPTDKMVEAFLAEWA